MVADPAPPHPPPPTPLPLPASPACTLTGLDPLSSSCSEHIFPFSAVICVPAVRFNWGSGDATRPLLVHACCPLLVHTRVEACTSCKRPPFQTPTGAKKPKSAYGPSFNPLCTQTPACSHQKRAFRQNFHEFPLLMEEMREFSSLISAVFMTFSLLEKRLSVSRMSPMTSATRVSAAPWSWTVKSTPRGAS